MKPEKERIKEKVLNEVCNERFRSINTNKKWLKHKKKEWLK